MREKELRGYPLDSEEHAVLMCSASWRSPVLTLRLALPFSAAEPAGDLPARRRGGLREGTGRPKAREREGTPCQGFQGTPPPPQSYERKHRSEGVSEECDPVARRLAQGTVGFGQGTRPGAGSVPSAQGAACGRQPINDSLTIDASNPLPPSESIKTLKGTRPFPQEGPWQGGGQGRTRGRKRGRRAPIRPSLHRGESRGHGMGVGTYPPLLPLSRWPLRPQPGPPSSRSPRLSSAASCSGPGLTQSPAPGPRGKPRRPPRFPVHPTARPDWGGGASKSGSGRTSAVALAGRSGARNREARSSEES